MAGTCGERGVPSSDEEEHGERGVPSSDEGEHGERGVPSSDEEDMGHTCSACFVMEPSEVVASVGGCTRTVVCVFSHVSRGHVTIT